MNSLPSYVKRRLLEYVSGYHGWVEEKDLSISNHQQYKTLVERFVKGEPLSRIVGTREFWSLPFHISPATLDPRPDSETLIEAILAKFPNKTLPLKVLDLGTGSGCLLLATLSEYPHAQGMGTDIQAEAIETAHKNGRDLKLSSRCQFMQTSWGEGLSETFNIILCNPPYIREDEFSGLDENVKEYDPYVALVSGSDGLECYQQVMPHIQKLLASNGLAFLEIGQGQAGDVSNIGKAHGLTTVSIYKDLAGIARCVVLKCSI